jgi:hypothetical protein
MENNQASIRLFRIYSYFVLFAFYYLWFVPPIELGSKKLFLTDWFFFPALCLLLGIAKLQKQQFLNLFKKIRVIFLALVIVLIHGFFRESFSLELQKIAYYIGNDSFSMASDGVMFVRLFLWVTTALTVHWFVSQENNQRLFKDIFFPLFFKHSLVVLGLTFLLFFWCRINPEAQINVGAFFNNNNSYEYWVSRVRGPFSSPMEAAIALILLTAFVVAVSLKENMKKNHRN